MTAAPRVSAGVLGTLLASAFLLALLALFQWMELLVAAAGGSLGCSVNATLDCAPAWGSAAAKAIGALARMPVAALGLVWGLAASAAAGVVAVRAATDRPLGAWVAAARWLSVAGVGASVALAGVSVSIGVLCPTCLVTYVLAFAFAGAAIKLPGSLGGPDVGPGLGRAVALALASYLALLWPASRTPQSMADVSKAAMAAVTARPSPSPSAPASAAPSPSAATATRAAAAPSPAGPSGIADMVAALPPRGQQILADVLLEYSMGETWSRPAPDKPRFVDGPADAPVTVVEWTDVMCGHCADFVATLHQLLDRLPPGVARIEPRQFPLDQECNASMSRTDGTGVRCAGARALVCLEGTPAFFAAQTEMFEGQASMTKPKLLDIARKHAPDKRAFEACLTSPATQKKIENDIAAALTAGIEGTPHVLINGKIASPFGPFLYVMLANGGRLDHPALAMLPKGQPPQPHDHPH